MIYLSGTVVPQRHDRIGFMMTPRRGAKSMPVNAVLAADNDCFTAPAFYSDERYAAFLRRMPRDRTLFASAPDVVGDHQATIERSLPMLRRIRELGHKAAFVAQDGWDEATTPWSEFDAIFIGGTTAFKFRGGRAAVAAAKRRGMWAHMGRVNSLDRLRAATAIGCDSVDGNYMAFGPDINWHRLKGWFDTMEAQPGLPV